MKKECSAMQEEKQERKRSGSQDKNGKNFKDSGVVRVDAARKPSGGPRKHPVDRAAEKSLKAFASIHNVIRSQQLK